MIVKLTLGKTNSLKKIILRVKMITTKKIMEKKRLLPQNWMLTATLLSKMMTTCLLQR